jgi:hypothetical protein
VDDVRWDTSLWRTKQGDGFLPVPKKVRGDKEEGAVVRVTFVPFDDED